MSQMLEITKNVDNGSEVINHDGPVRITQDVELLRIKALYVTRGYITFDGVGGSMKLAIEKLVVNDPRTQDGKPTDAYHLGGVSGAIGTMIGSGLQGDLAKIGRGAKGLHIGHVIGNAVAMENPQKGGGAAGDKHQDGIQIMDASNIVIELLDYTGGPNTNHAAFFCNPAGPGADETNSRTIHDCVVLGGTILTKATGVALGACTGCGAKNMHITAKYPWRKNEYTKDQVDVDNLKTVVGRR